MRSNVSKVGNNTASKKFNSKDLRALATTGGPNGNNPYKYNILKDYPDDSRLVEEKLKTIEKNNGDLYYFEQDANRKTYHLSFETTGETDVKRLVYAVGMKGDRIDDNPQTPVTVRFIANQWYAKTSSENTYADQYTPTITYPTYIVKQGEYKNQQYGFIQNWDRHPENTTALLNYDSHPHNQANFDANNYYYFKNDAGESSEEILRKANEKGFNDSFQIFNSDGHEISKREMGTTGADVPGMHEYTWKWTFRDGSVATKRVKFAVIPQKPNFNQQLKFIGETQDITATANGGAKASGVTMVLYREHTVNGRNVTEQIGDPVAANSQGKATFSNVTIQDGKYYVRTVIKTDEYRDYKGNKHKTLESDPVNENEKLVAVEAPTVKLNGKKLTTNAADNRFIIYRGAVFNPTFRVENDGKQVNSLKASGIPKGVWFNKVNGGDQPRTNMAHGSEYTISTNNVVDSDTRLGEGTATVTVVNHQGKSIDYKFKYIVADVQGQNTTENKLVGDTIGNPQRFVKATIGNVEGDQYFPEGMSFKWITNTLTLPENTATLGEAGRTTNYNAQVIFPHNGPFEKTIDRVKYTIYAPIAKTIPVTFNVTDNVAPTVKLGTGNGGTILTESESNAPEITIYRGANFTDTIKVFDNESRGIVNLKVEGGLPDGLSLEGRSAIQKTSATEGREATVNISGKVATTARLGVQNVNLKVSDDPSGNVDRGNTKTVKFKVKVLDLAFESRGKAINENTHSDTLNLNQTSVDANHYLTVTDGINKRDMFPQGMIFRYILADGTIKNTLSFDKPGKYTVTAAAYYPKGEKSVAGAPIASTNLKGEGVAEIAGRPYLTKQITFEVKPTAPVVEPQDNGDVLITPTNQTNVDKVGVTFTKQDDSTVVTYTARKNDRGVWEFGADAPLTVDPTTSVFKLKDRVVKDGTTVTAKALTTDETGSVQSNPVTGRAGNGDAEYPRVTFTNNVKTDAQGNSVVYITPTETTNLHIATVSDNSKKLLEAVFFDQGAKVTDLGNYGITYNKVTRNGDTITNAPYTLTVTGTLNREKSANTLWNDGDVITTRYASAMDAAENNIKDKSGSRDNVASNPYRVVFKTLTQARKYIPTVSKTKIERDITQANATITDPEFNKIKETLTFSSTRGEVKVRKDTTGLRFEITNRTVQAKQDGSLYVTATVVYPDGSREDIEVPLDTTNANKAKPTLTIPEVSVKAAKAKNEQGRVPATEYNRVLSNVTVPQGQPQPTAKEVKNNGLISEVDGKKVVTVGLTFKDNTKKDVTVPVLEVKPIDIVTTFNEKDNTVTIKPNTTVEINDRLQFGIRGKSMALTKTASGYTNSVKDRTITVNRDGSITITLVGEEKFQAGDRIVTRHESNKNGKVDSYETEAFAGLQPVEKVPALNLTNLSPKEIEAVKVAVKKANPSVNVEELQVAANGDVTYRHKGAGVASDASAPVARLEGNVIKKPSVPEIKTDLAGKAETKTPVTVEVKAEPGSTVKLYDKDNTEIGTGTANDEGIATIEVAKIPVGPVTAKAIDKYDNESGTSAAKEATDKTAPDAPEIKTDLAGKAETKTPVTVEVKAEPGSTVKLYDKDNTEIGTGTANDEGIATIEVAKIPVGPVTAKAIDKAGNPSEETVEFVSAIPKVKVPVESFGNLTKDEQDKVKESVEKANPGKTVVVEPSGKVIITDSKTNVSHEISEELVTTIAPPVVDIPEFNGGVNGEPETQEELPKFNGGVNAPDSPIHEVPEFNGGVNGEPEVQAENPGYNGPIGTTGVDENGELIQPPVVDLPEFTGGVNGELPEPTELPKVSLIITKWIDENGNELKPADAKAPTVLGEANEAFEHGEIEGYVFVRTETKGDVVTHIFRKVSPIRPTGDGQQRPATPSTDTNRRPDTATPAEVPATQPTEQPSQTVEVPAQLPNEVSETNPSVSQPQAVLPNTGTQEDRATGALGVLSLLGAFGLLFAKKKKDDEEEA